MTESKIYHVCVGCTPYHIDNCELCFGYGLRKGTMNPVKAWDIASLTECDPCPECGGDLKNEHLYKLEKQSQELSLERLRSIRYKTESATGTFVKAMALHIDKNSIQTNTDNGDGTFTHTYTFKSDQ